MSKGKHSGKYRGGFLLKFAVFCLAAVVVLSLVERQIQIAEKREQLQQLQTQLEVQNEKNEQLKASLNNDDEALQDYAEKRARRDLGYAKPHERVFVDVGGGD